MTTNVKQQTCIDCGAPSPQTETNYTLISSLHGWRLKRYRNEKGLIVLEWRCPKCWRAHKRR